MGMWILLLFTTWALGATELNITPVPNGVVLFGQNDLLREQGQAEVYIIIDQHENDFTERMKPVVELLLKWLQTVQMDENIERILQERIERLSKPRRIRRGLINLVGKVAKTLIGTVLW